MNLGRALAILGLFWLLFTILVRPVRKPTQPPWDDLTTIEIDPPVTYVVTMSPPDGHEDNSAVSDDQKSEPAPRRRTDPQNHATNLARVLQSIEAGKVIRQIEKVEAAINSLRQKRIHWQRTSQEAFASDHLRHAPEITRAWEDLKLNPLATEENLKGWENSLSKLKSALLPIQADSTEQIVEFPEGYQSTITQIELSVRAESDRLSILQFRLSGDLEAVQKDRSAGIATTQSGHRQ